MSMIPKVNVSFGGETVEFMESKSMSDYIKREDAERAIEEDFRHACHPYEWMGLEDALDDLSRVSSANVVEVVRCKDCIHNGSIDTDCPFGWKDKKFNMPKPNDFCSYGE